MTSREFRSLALSFPEVEERSHFNHPDFRVCGKIFATLGYPRWGWAVVKLTPRQQQGFVRADPDAFVTVRGKWGLRGATSVLLRPAKKSDVRRALIAAWRNAAPRRLTERIDLQ
jgi:hypothetical protein